MSRLKNTNYAKGLIKIWSSSINFRCHIYAKNKEFNSCYLSFHKKWKMKNKDINPSLHKKCLKCKMWKLNWWVWIFKFGSFLFQDFVNNLHCLCFHNRDWCIKNALREKKILWNGFRIMRGFYLEKKQCNTGVQLQYWAHDSYTTFTWTISETQTRNRTVASLKCFVWPNVLRQGISWWT